MSIQKKIIFIWLSYFICISVMTGATNADIPAKTENSSTEEKKTTTDVPLTPGPSLIKKLTAKILPNKKSVRLDWEAPEEEGEIIIARSYSEINSMDKLQIADSLGKFPSNKKDSITSFTDYNLRTGKYYYAIVMASDVRKGNITFIQDTNYISKPIAIKRPIENNDNIDSEPSQETTKKNEITAGHYIKNLTVKPEGQFLRLKWEPPANADELFPIYTIYKSNEPLSSLPLIGKSEKIVEVNHPDTTFLDQDLHKSQTLYYGISITLNEKETIPLVKNKSYVRVFYIRENEKKDNTQVTDNSSQTNSEKSTVEKEDEEESELPKKPKEEKKKEEIATTNKNNLDEILLNTYWKKRYEEAVFQLSDYLKNEKDFFYRGKANLYIALSYYKLRNYRETLYYMLKEETRLYNEERADFYIKRCIEYLGAKK